MFSQDDLKSLYNKATEFLRSRPCKIDDVQQLIRCKRMKYFSEIEKTEEKIEQPYLKDRNGHEKSPINEKLEGLFLTPGTLPYSPFGNRCYVYPLDALISANEHDLYFADFYCPLPGEEKKNKPSLIKQGNHKVTLVIARKGSNGHDFCEATLVRLSWFDNPFFRLSPDSKSAKVAKIKKKVPLVEIFLTEALCLKKGKGKPVRPFGPGRSNPKGLPNNKCCPICNIDVGFVHPTYHIGGVAPYLRYP